MAIFNISDWKTNETTAKHDAEEKRTEAHGASPKKKSASCGVVTQENIKAACGADAKKIRPAACGAEAPSEQKSMNCSNDCKTFND